jgi:hypothetical protein
MKMSNTRLLGLSHLTKLSSHRSETTSVLMESTGAFASLTGPGSSSGSGAGMTSPSLLAGGAFAPLPAALLFPNNPPSDMPKI